MSEDYDKLEQTNPSLLRRIQDHANDGAWNEFDALYRPMLRRFAEARGLSDADVEDVIQHCMASICAHIRRFSYDPARGRFKGWLRTMVNNRCRDLRRARRADVEDNQAMDRVTADENSPQDAFDKVWVEEHLKHCLRKMREEVDETAFTAFQRYVLEGTPAEQVCQDMALTYEQLYKIKWRLTRTLRAWMTELVGEEYAPPT